MFERRMLSRFARRGEWRLLAAVAGLSLALSGCGLSNMKDILTDKPDDQKPQQQAAKPTSGTPGQ